MRKILIVMLALLVLAGCKTTHEVQRVVVRDTMLLVHRDTVRVETIRFVGRDSVVRDTIILVKDTAGKVVYKEVIRDRAVRVLRGDTARVVVSRQDSAARQRLEAMRQGEPHSVGRHYAKSGGKRASVGWWIKGVGAMGVVVIVGWGVWRVRKKL